MMILVTFYLIFPHLLLGAIHNQFHLAGPGLSPDKIILPCRYFFIKADSDITPDTVTKDLVEVEIIGKDDNDRICRAHTELYQISSRLFLVRYKVYYSCHNVQITVKISGEHVSNSPVKMVHVTQPDTCHCPENWIENTCHGDDNLNQMEADLDKFRDGVNMRDVVQEARKVFSHGGSQCWCHYAVKDGEIYRKCYGQHVGFNMFWDSILTWLARRFTLPDLDIIVNLGDWPLVKRGRVPLLPMISWCGSQVKMNKGGIGMKL